MRTETAGGVTGHRLPGRESVDNRFKWDLAVIYADPADWEADLCSVEDGLLRLGDFRGRLAASAAVLLDFFRTRDRLLETAGRLSAYAQLSRDQDTRSAEGQGLSERAARLATAIGEALAFVVPELHALEPGRIEQFLSTHDELAVYRHHLDEIERLRPHTLSPREEELVAMTRDMARAPGNIFSMLNNADLSFPTVTDEQGEEVEVTKGRYHKLLESPDRRVRRETFEAFLGTYEKFKNTCAASLQAQVKRNQFYARVRNYPSALHAALGPNHIPVSVFENLIATVGAALAPLHRYCDLRKRVLHLDELHPYDMSAPLVPSARMSYSYERAVELVRAALAPLGDEYASVLGRAFSERWIDVYETEGKRAGAYSGGAYGTPPYILLNFNGTLHDVFTLAHELGHSVHSYFTRGAQPFVYGDYSVFVAEVASTASESLLLDHLLGATRDRAQRLYLLNHWLDQIRGTFYAQVMFAEFEWQIHRAVEAGRPLTQESLGRTFGALYDRYHGPDMRQDDLHFCGWSRIPHFYYNFYVYQYATGYAAATDLTRRILDDGAPALQPYLRFLKAGSSHYPIDLLAAAGVDMTRSEPLIATVRLFERLLDDLEELLADDGPVP